jgi:response regulator NasT
MKKDMRKILVVDDDLLVLATLSLGLNQAGYQVLQADSGELAIRICAKESFDLAILDMRMPGINGLDVAKTLREKDYAPFIFLSAFNDDELVREAAAAGALGYLVKPLEISRIVPAVEIALVRHDELSKLEVMTANLAEAMAGNREIDIAIGLLMERYKSDRASVFNAMRAYARSNRCKVVSVAQRLISGEQLELSELRKV